MHQSTKLLAYFRGMRLACHIIYGLVLACFFSSLKQNLRNKIMKRWSHALLDILNVKLQIRGCNELADREGFELPNAKGFDLSCKLRRSIESSVIGQSKEHLRLSVIVEHVHCACGR